MCRASRLSIGPNFLHFIMLSAVMSYNIIWTPMTASFILLSALQWYWLCGWHGGSLCDRRGWYSENMLDLNDDKTEMLIIWSKPAKYGQVTQIPNLHVGSCVTAPDTHIKDLGVIMDSNFTMELHINRIIRTAFFKIREISFHWKF